MNTTTTTQLQQKCSSPTCTEAFPEFYPNSGSRRCVACLRAKQRAYRASAQGEAMHHRYRNSVKGRYQQSLRKAKYLTLSTITRQTLQDMPYHHLCQHCIENVDGTGNLNCAVSQGAESVDLCLVYQDFKDGGAHPLTMGGSSW